MIFTVHLLREGDRTPLGLRTAWAHAVEAARFDANELTSRLQNAFKLNFADADAMARHVKDGGEKAWGIVPTIAAMNEPVFGSLGRLDNMTPGGPGEFVAFTRVAGDQVVAYVGERKGVRGDRGEVQRIVQQLTAAGHSRLNWAVVPIRHRPQYSTSKP